MIDKSNCVKSVEMEQFFAERINQNVLNAWNDHNLWHDWHSRRIWTELRMHIWLNEEITISIFWNSFTVKKHSLKYHRLKVRWPTSTIEFGHKFWVDIINHAYSINLIFTYKWFSCSESKLHVYVKTNTRIKAFPLLNDSRN